MSSASNPFAFPGQSYGADGMPCDEASTGMTLRDWFAGQALIGVMSMLPHLRNIKTADGGDIEEEHMAKSAFAIADAMLAAREQSHAS